MNNLIGIKKIKKIYLNEFHKKPDISNSALKEFNTFLNSLVNLILLKANEFREIKDTRKRLTYEEIRLAIYKLKMEELRNYVR